MILRRKLQVGEANEQLVALLTNLPENNDHIANYILEHGGQLPLQPMFEKHPYLDDNPLQNFDKYIIGTFPPISYIFDNQILVENNIGQNNGPIISYFHGNDLSLWKFLLNEEEYGRFEDSLLNNGSPTLFIKNLLSDLKVNYSDIIKYCRRKEFTTKDDDLYNIIINYDLIEHILNNPSENIILNFNTSTIYNKQNFKFHNGLLSDKEVKSLNLFLRSLQDMGYSLLLDLHDGQGYISINNIAIPHYYKVLFRLKIEKNNFKKEFIINTTPSPSGDANRTFPRNLVFVRWLNQQNNIIQNTPTIHFRKYLYQLFRDGDVDALSELNIYNYAQ